MPGTPPRTTIAPPWASAVARGHLAVALVRHGRTRWNHERRFLGVTDLPLDDVGRAQADALSRSLGRPFTRVYTSPLLRARQTAEVLDPEPVPVDGLRELCQGELEGLQATDAMGRYPEFFARWADDPRSTRVPGGESLGECRDRAMVALDELAGRHRGGEVIACVTHQLVIAGVTCTVLGEGLRCWRDHGVGNTGITVLTHDGRRWAVEARGWAIGGGPGPGGV